MPTGEPLLSCRRLVVLPSPPPSIVKPTMQFASARSNAPSLTGAAPEQRRARRGCLNAAREPTYRRRDGSLANGSAARMPTLHRHSERFRLVRQRSAPRSRNARPRRSPSCHRSALHRSAARSRRHRRAFRPEAVGLSPNGPHTDRVRRCRRRESPAIRSDRAALGERPHPPEYCRADRRDWRRVRDEREGSPMSPA